jgi:hypothetical protein
MQTSKCTCSWNDLGLCWVTLALLHGTSRSSLWRVAQENCPGSSAFFFTIMASQKPQETFNLIPTEERYWALFYMPLYTFIRGLLNVLVQVANKMRLRKKKTAKWNETVHLLGRVYIDCRPECRVSLLACSVARCTDNCAVKVAFISPRSANTGAFAGLHLQGMLFINQALSVLTQHGFFKPCSFVPFSRSRNW